MKRARERIRAAKDGEASGSSDNEKKHGASMKSKTEEKVQIAPDLSHLTPSQQQVILAQTEPGHGKRTPSYFDLYRFATPLEKCYNLLGVMTAIGAGVCQPIMIFVLGNLITDFVNYTTAVNTGINLPQAEADLSDGIREGALYLVYIGIAMFGCTYIYMGIWSYNGEKIAKRIREQYFAAVLRQNIGFWETIGAGEITTRLTTDSNLIQRGISEKVCILVQYLTQFVAGFVVAFIKDWRLAFALSAMMPVMTLAASVYYSIDTKSRAASMAHISEGANIAEEVFSAVRTVYAYGSQRKVSNLYEVTNIQARKEANKGVTAAALTMSVYYFAFYAGYALAIFFGTMLVYQGKAAVGDIIACMEAVIIGALSIALIGPQTQAIQGATGACSKILPTIWRIPPIDSASEEGKRPASVEGELKFNKVQLYYPSRPSVKVLDDFSATIPKGKITALVGSSGSGKSSVIGLLERFYNPVAGEIYLDGLDIASLNIQWLRSQIGLVSQEPTLFAGTVYDNVAYGLTNTRFDGESVEQKKQRVIEACKVANADTFVRQLSDGYDTLVGERGLLLSGGQAQRIAIARAIIAEPPILVLDEATSALDVTSERLVQKALNNASVGRTTIAIAHRLSTIADADQIIVMANGKIVEKGTHTSLLEDRSGVYAGLVALQSLRQGKEQATDADSSDVTNEEIDEPAPILVRAATAYSTGAHTEDGELGAEKKSMSLIRIALRLVNLNKGMRWMYFLALFGCAISGTAFPAVSILFGSLLETFSDRPAEQWQSRNNYLAGCMFAVACVTGLSIMLQFYVTLFTAESMTMKLRSKMFQTTLKQDIEFFDETKNSTGALTSAISQKPQQVNSAAGMTICAIFQSIITLVVGLIIAFVYSWKVALVALACVPLIMGAGFARFIIVEMKDAKTDAIHNGVAQMACEAASAIRTVASLRREGVCVEKYSSALAYRTALFGNLLFSAGQALQFPILALIMWWGSTRMINDGLSAGDFFVALFGGLFAAIESASIFTYVPDISGAKQGAVAAFRLLDSKPKTDADATTGQVIKSSRGHILFTNVNFRYPTRPGVPVLRGLDLEVQPGQFVALVGPSGCGKSTTIQLMERFYDPTRGTITLDGIDIRSINLKCLRSELALVSQTPTLFEGTVRSNITLGAVEDVTQEAIESAARLANIHDFIVGLPDGYETMVGSKGSQLSGGQKQRIAIARALIRNPKVLLLDEATSALDSQSEKVVQDALDAAAKERTTICIAHRLSTIQNADVICVFKEGSIAEKGSHDELLRRKGLYYHLVQEQSLSA